MAFALNADHEAFGGKGDLLLHRVKLCLHRGVVRACFELSRDVVAAARPHVVKHARVQQLAHSGRSRLHLGDLVPRPVDHHAVVGHLL